MFHKMFSLTEQDAKLMNVNLRSEIHGDEMMPACDLKFEIKTDNSFLDRLEPGLKAAFFAPPSDDSAQPDLDINSEDYMPELKYKLINVIKLSKVCEGYRFVAHYGFTGYSDVPLIGTTIDTFSFTIEEGGQTTITFRVKCKPSEEDIGTFYRMNKQVVSISVVPPSPEEAAQNVINAAVDDSVEDDYDFE